MINSLMKDHQGIRGMADELEAIVTAPFPTSLAALADCRWRFARDVIIHLSREDHQVFAPLLNASKPSLVRTAEQLNDELFDLYDAFQFHVDRWRTDLIAGDWEAYRTDVQTLLCALRRRMAREETILYPLVAELSSADTVEKPMRNWAGDAWLLRDAIRP